MDVKSSRAPEMPGGQEYVCRSGIGVSNNPKSLSCRSSVADYAA